MHPDVEHLRRLPIAEKLRVVEELWDDIGASGKRFPFLEWHREEALRRAAELEADASMALSGEELWRGGWREYNALEGEAMIELTPKQREAVRKGEAVEVRDPEVGQVVVIAAGAYQQIRESFEEEEQRREIARVASRNAGLRAQE